MTDAEPNCLDLFCGIGGLSLGLQLAGLNCVGGVDCWEDAARTYEHNLGHTCLRADIRALSPQQLSKSLSIALPDIDIVAGGPPCQGFSTVGKRDGEDPRNELWLAFRNMVAQIRPAYVVMENVEGMLVMDDGRIRDKVIESFEAIGYRMKCRLLLSCDYGIPQLRKRAVFLGWLEDICEPEFPAPTGQIAVTVADAISDLPELLPSEEATEYSGPARTPYQIARRKETAALHNHEAAKHAKHLVEAISHIPDGGNRQSIPTHLQFRSGFHNSYSRLASWKPAVAVTSNMRKPSSARAIHPTQHRGLTVREGLRLQSFDDDFIVLGTRTSQYLQVGNAVPPLLGLAIGSSILAAYRATPTKTIRSARGQVLQSRKRQALLFDDPT